MLSGRSNHEIAEPLSSSERTVEAHMPAIFNKLNVHSRAEFVALLHARYDAGYRGKAHDKEQTSGQP